MIVLLSVIVAVVLAFGAAAFGWWLSERYHENTMKSAVEVAQMSNSFAIRMTRASMTHKESAAEVKALREETTRLLKQVDDALRLVNSNTEVLSRMTQSILSGLVDSRIIATTKAPTRGGTQVGEVPITPDDHVPPPLARRPPQTDDALNEDYVT